MTPHPLVDKNVLVIDDDEIFYEIVSYFLSEKGVKSESALTIEQGVSKVREKPYDFILIDSFLPDGMGIEIIPIINSMDYTVPMMMVTGNDDQEYMKACFEAGVSDYILKPANIELLWLKIQRCYNTFLLEQKLQSQNRQLESLLNVKRQEEDLARHVYKHLSQPTEEVDHAIHCHMQSSSLFNGDFFLSGQSPTGNKILTLVDATGHGLAAAISVLPLVSTIRAMIKKGLSLPHLAYELNAKLYDEIPDDRFVAGIGVEYDVSRNELHIFNAGMPEAILLNEHCQPIEHIKSATLPLGILDPQTFEPAIKTFTPGKNQYLLLYSDGLIEQSAHQGELFGKEKLVETLANCNSPERIVADLVDAFNKHRQDETVTDDVSICCVNLDMLKEHNQTAMENAQQRKVGDLSLSFDISGYLLGEADVLSVFDEALHHCKLDISLRKKAFTVFAELINNAVDHGVLNLESSLKNDFSGFADYLKQRESGISALSRQDQIRIELNYNAQNAELRFDIRDSGSGYQPGVVVDTNENALSGRGIKLVDELSEEYVVHSPGNRSSVVIK